MTANSSPSATRLWPCGGIFDAPAQKTKLQKIEEQIAAPDFWSQPEKSQKIMQERKRLEQSIASDERIRSMTDDLDTLFELAREGENVWGDIERDIKSYSELLERLETSMLLSGENDARRPFRRRLKAGGQERRHGIDTSREVHGDDLARVVPRRRSQDGGASGVGLRERPALQRHVDSCPVVSAPNQTCTWPVPTEFS